MIRPGIMKKAGDVAGGQTRFGSEDPVVFARVAVGHEVVEEVAEQLSQDDRRDRCQVDVPDGFGSESVAAGNLRGLQKDGRRDVDAHSPHKSQCAGGLY
jgi:hypothetical protein